MRNRTIQAALAALFLLAAPAGAFADHPQGCNAGVVSQVADVMLVRPVSLGMTITSSSLWAGLSPLLMLVGLSDSWGHYLVEEPWSFTGGRFAGCFSGERAYQR